MATDPKPPSGPVTPESVYLNRRSFLKAGAVVATAAATGAVYRHLNPPPAPTKQTAALAGLVKGPSADGDHLDPKIVRAFHVDEPMTRFESVTHYNNFYEFSTSKSGVAETVGKFNTTGWTVAVDGMCAAPKTFDLDDLRKISPPEERVYRMRCVEALVDGRSPGPGSRWPEVDREACEPMQRCEVRRVPDHVARQLARFPGQNTDAVLDWPYVEGLRLDEAMHPLTIAGRRVSTADELPAAERGAGCGWWSPGNTGSRGSSRSSRSRSWRTGRRLRRGIARAPSEYGFYANVNPDVRPPADGARRPSSGSASRAAGRR